MRLRLRWHSGAKNANASPNPTHVPIPYDGNNNIKKFFLKLLARLDCGKKYDTYLADVSVIFIYCTTLFNRIIYEKETLVTTRPCA